MCLKVVFYPEMRHNKKNMIRVYTLYTYKDHISKQNNINRGETSILSCITKLKEQLSHKTTVFIKNMTFIL